MGSHWFWLGLTILCLIWYSVITLYVAVRGGFDIKHMLRALSELDSLEGGQEEHELARAAAGGAAPAKD